MKLKTVKEKVLFALESSEECRNDDSKLYFLVCEIVLKEKGLSAFGLSFCDAMRRRDELGLPTFEAVRRTRQLIVSDRIDLQADKKTKKAREEKQDEYYLFVKNNTERSVKNG